MKTLDLILYTCVYTIFSFLMYTVFYYVVLNGTVLATTLFIVMVMVLSFMRAAEKVSRKYDDKD